MSQAFKTKNRQLKHAGLIFFRKRLKKKGEK